MRVPAGDVVAAYEHSAAVVVESELACQTFEERALAGAIGADQAAQFPLAQIKIDVVHRNHPTETHGEFMGFHHAAHDRSAGLTTSRRRAAPSLEPRPRRARLLQSS